MVRRPHLHRRILSGFLLFALLCALLFGLLNLLFMYVTEDSILEQQLRTEVARQQQLSQPVTPPYPHLRLYKAAQQFPADLASRYDQAERGEYSGQDGRHYHLRRFSHPAAPAPLYLVAEVSSQLVVRPVLTQMLLLYALVGLVLLLLALVLGWYLARRVSTPLTTLAALVQQQPLSVAFASQFQDAEIYALASRLEQSICQLQQYAERERQFSRTASHELRTPLSVIQTSCELLQLTPHDAVSARRLTQIQQASQQMQQLMQTLLYLARDNPLPRQHIDWPTLLAQGWQQQQAWQPRPELTVSIRCCPQANWQLPLEPVQLLLASLLQNMLRHSGAGQCQLTVSATAIELRNPLPCRAVAPGSAAATADPALQGFGQQIAQTLAARCYLMLQHHQADSCWVSRLACHNACSDDL